LEQNYTQQASARRNAGSGGRFDRLAICERVADRGVARDAFGKFDPRSRIAPLEQFLGAFVREIETRLHVDDRLAHHAEPEVARLDDTGMHGADRDLVNTFAANGGERKRLPIVAERFWFFVLPQRVIPLRPEPMFDERARI